jgi:hypothetical protein
MGDDEAFAFAERMGLEGYHCASGDDGTVVFLEDGRVLKLTGNRLEAALCLSLMALQAGGHAHPAVPVIDAVYAHDGTVELSPLADAVVPYRRYAILRESFDDIYEPSSGPDDYRRLAAAWASGEARRLRPFREGRHGAQLASVLSGLEWVLENTGFAMRDIRPSNVGESRLGIAGMRDLGRAEVDPALVERLLAADIPPPFPEPVPAPGM